MADLELYLYSNCSSCKNASALVVELGVSATRRDIFKDRLSVEELKALFERAHLDPQAVLSTRSRPYNEFGLAGKSLSDGEILELMSQHPALIRRPLIVKGDRAVIGCPIALPLPRSRLSSNQEEGTIVVLEFGAHVSAAGGVDLALDRAAEFEMTSCQIFTKNERQWNAKPLDPGVVERFLARKSERGMGTIISHDSYLINMATPDDALWERSRLGIQEELRRCDELDVPYLVSHPGAHVGAGLDFGIPRIADAINRVHDEMPNGKAIILLETTAGQGTTIGSKFDELAAIIDMVDDKDRIGVCLDTCHVFAAGYELRDAEGYNATIGAFDSIIGLSRLKCIHINDSQKGLGERVDRHAHIGEGMLGDAAFTLLVNDSRLRGLPGVLETPKGDDEKADGINLARLRGLVGKVS